MSVGRHTARVRRALYGPTTGDRIRLADTDLWMEIEADRGVYGDEARFGGGKVIREGWARGDAPRARRTWSSPTCVVLDYWGVVKADVGIGRADRQGIGKAGNPDVMDGVDPLLVIGAGTEVLAGEGMILTAGAIDAHVHLIAPQQIDEAICLGGDDLLGGGIGPAGAKATTCTPGPWNLARMLESADAYRRQSSACSARATRRRPEALVEQLAAGASGFKLHEDWDDAGGDRHVPARGGRLDVQVALHTDTLNEAGFVEDDDRRHRRADDPPYHTEGAGGGHAPDILKIASVRQRPAVVDQSRRARYTVNTLPSTWTC